MTPSGLTLNADDADDMFLEDLIERCSREFDGLMGRKFYPRVETHYYDRPTDEYLYFDDDLLAIITLTNGNGTAIASTEYHFKPFREYPKYALYLTDITDTVWEEDTSNSSQEVIDLVGIWGYREDYATHAWVTGSTLNEIGNLNATDTTFTVTSGTKFLPGMIIKIENELMIIDSVSTNDLTVTQRGDNGSTAATHANATAVYYWRHPDDIVKFVLGMAQLEYKSRFHPEAMEVTTYISPAGIVTNPKTYPGNVRDMVNHYKRRV